MDSGYTLENGYLLLNFDSMGRLIGFYSKLLGYQWISPGYKPGNWKIALLTGGYPVQYIMGRDQTPANVEQHPDTIEFVFDPLTVDGQAVDIGVSFCISLVGEEVHFSLKIRNASGRRIREAWVPIMTGFEGYSEEEVDHIVHLARAGLIGQDVLRKGLPEAEYMFCVDGELAEYRYRPSFESMPWMDLYGDGKGLYVAVHDAQPNLQVLRIEKSPPELGTEFRGGDERVYFPPDVPRWMSIMAGQLTTIDHGDEWESPTTVFWPHRGDWHIAAEHYRIWALNRMNFVTRPAKLAHHTGWLHLVGKNYLGEINFTFEGMGEAAIAAMEKTGLTGLLVSGHTEKGLYSADSSLTPAKSLGGVNGFKKMCEKLHRFGMHVVVSTFRQSAVAMDREDEFAPYKGWTMLDRLGEPRSEYWSMGSLEAAYGFEAGAPLWARVCPSCLPWWSDLLKEIRQLADLGCDGICLQTFGQEGGICYAGDHGHKPGAWMTPVLRDRLAWLWDELQRSHPGFFLAADGFSDWAGQYFTLAYKRKSEGNGYQVFPATFPEIKRQLVVDTNSERQVAKAFLMSWGWIVEIDGGRKGLDGTAPWVEKMSYFSKIRQTYPQYLLNGRYLDQGPFLISGDGVQSAVHQGPDGYAVVLWNPFLSSVVCQVISPQPCLCRLLRYNEEDKMENLPAEFEILGGEVCVLLVK